MKLAVGSSTTSVEGKSPYSSVINTNTDDIRDVIYFLGAYELQELRCLESRLEQLCQVVETHTVHAIEREHDHQLVRVDDENTGKKPTSCVVMLNSLQSDLNKS